MLSLLFYFLVFLITSQISLFAKRVIKSKPLYFIVVLFLPVIVATTRIDVGTDYSSYYWYYNQVITGTDGNVMEFLFKNLNIVSYHLFHDYRGVLFLSSLLCYGFVLASLVRLDTDISVAAGLWAFFCCYFSASLNVMRQLIAVAIILYALTYLNQKKYKQYIILTIIATLFHTSAIIAILFIFIRLISENKIKHFILLSFGISLIFIFLGRNIINVIPDFLQTKYSIFFKNTDSIVDFKYILDILPTFLIVISSTIYYLAFIRKDGNYDFFCILSFCTLPILVLGYYIDYFQRVLYYVDISQIIIVSLIFKSNGFKKRYFIVSVLWVLFYAFYFWYSVMYKGSNEIIPYMSTLF